MTPPADNLKTDLRSVNSLVALNRTQLSEWLDGINALRSDFARVATSETKDLVDQLTAIGLKVRPLLHPSIG